MKNTKKLLTVFLCAGLTVSSLTGCAAGDRLKNAITNGKSSSKKSESSTSELTEIKNAKSYITLSDYKTINLKTADIDKQVESKIAQDLESYTSYKKIKKGKVKKGDTVDLNLTFPESYPSTELAGKDVVFTVTVNGVKRKPQLNDEWLAANTNYATLAEFAAETKQKLEDAAETTASNTLESSGLDQVISNSTVKKYYKSLIEQGESQYEKRLNAYASAYGKSLSELLAAQGMTESQYQNQKQKQAVSYAQVAMVVYAIAQDAGLSEADAEYQTILNDLANNYNMDAATFSSTYGESLVKSSVMSQYAMNYIVSNANVTTQEVEETEETTTAAE